MKYIVTCALILILAGSNTAFGGTPTVTNRTNTAFTVSWTTIVHEKGWVEYGTNASCLNMKAYDDRGQETVDDTHYVTITGLSGTTTYCQVVSGGAKGNISTIATVPALSLQPGVAFGEVYFQGTTIPAEGSIVYAILKTTSGTESDTQSTIVKKNEPWQISLNSFRNMDGCSSFQYSSGDWLIIKVDAAGDGMATETTIIGTITNNIIDTGTLTLAGDIVAPSDISTSITPGDGRVQIGLTMPVQDTGVAGVIILRREGDYPQATLTVGQIYPVGTTVTDSIVVYVATDTTTWTDGTLTNGVKYYYRIFTYDGVYNYSQGSRCYATPGKDLGNASVFPNPLVGDGVVCFDKLLANTHICIYNIAGELVLEAEAPNETYLWSTRDAASGIYLYLLKSDGYIRTGKIGIVR